MGSNFSFAGHVVSCHSYSPLPVNHDQQPQTVPKRMGVSVFQWNFICLNIEIWTAYTFHTSWTTLLNSSPQLFKNAKIILSLWSWKTGWLARFTPTGCSLPTTTALNLHLWLKKSSHCGVQTSKGARIYINHVESKKVPFGIWKFQMTYIPLSPTPSLLPPFLCPSNMPPLKWEVWAGALLPGSKSYLLFDFLELPALLSDIMEELQCFVVLLGHLHPCLLQTSL